METAEWSQMMMKPMEEIVTANAYPKPPSERKVRPHKEQALNCPRCNSTNTKFCYYNNYSLSQPRYFCKTCRRYWTEGGSLRNIPVGGGSRKNKRSSSSPSTSSTSSSSSSSIISSSRANISNKPPDLVPSVVLQQNPKNVQETQDLNLGFATPQDLKAINELIQFPSFEGDKELQNPSSNPSSASTQHHSHFTALEPLNGITATASRGLNSFISIPLASSSGPTTVSYSSGLPLHSLNFSLDGLGSGNCGSFQGVQETTGKLLFPFQGLKQGSDSTVDAEQSSVKNGDSTAGYWNGVIGGGSW